jgi:hypothetical protein
MNDQIITKAEARLLKPYLKYMDFCNVQKERQFLVERAMYQNMLLGNISRSFIKELRENFIRANPGSEIPIVLREEGNE